MKNLVSGQWSIALLLALIINSSFGQNKTYTHQTVPTTYVKVNGIDYAYRSFGKKGGVPIIFLQHFTGTMDNWDPTITNALSKNYHVILFNNTGVSSTGGKTPETVAEMGEDAVAFINALGFKKVDLLGFSLGGFVAQHIAEKHPDLVRKVILSGTGPLGGDGIENLPVTMAEAFKQPSFDDVMLFLFFDKTESSREAGKLFLKRLQERKEGRDPNASNETMAAQTKAIVAYGNDKGKNFSQLKNIKQPVLIVNGNNDIMVPSVNSFYMEQYLPNAKLVLWPNSGHGGFFQYHENFVKEADLFLSAN